GMSRATPHVPVTPPLARLETSRSTPQHSLLATTFICGNEGTARLIERLNRLETEGEATQATPQVRNWRRFMDQCNIYATWQRLRNAEMRVLLLSQWYTAESDIRIHSLARTLTARGHPVTVMTGFPNYPNGRVYPGYRIRWRQWEEHNGIRVLRLLL